MSVWGVRGVVAGTVPPPVFFALYSSDERGIIASLIGRWVGLDTPEIDAKGGVNAGKADFDDDFDLGRHYPRRCRVGAVGHFGDIRFRHGLAQWIGSLPLRENDSEAQRCVSCASRARSYGLIRPYSNPAPSPALREIKTASRGLPSFALSPRAQASFLSLPLSITTASQVLMLALKAAAKSTRPASLRSTRRGRHPSVVSVRWLAVVANAPIPKKTKVWDSIDEAIKDVKSGDILLSGGASRAASCFTRRTPLTARQRRVRTVGHPRNAAAGAVEAERRQGCRRRVE